MDKQRGFTVIEMMFAAVIMALLIVAISSSVGNFTVKAKLASTKMNCRVVQNVITGYSTEHHGDYPTSRAQYRSSPTYQQLSNPFDETQKGIGKWGSNVGNSSDDNSDPRAPVVIWNVDPEMVTLTNTAGVVFYVPYKNATEVAAGVSSVPIGGDAGSSGYTAYTIQAMGIFDTLSPLAVPVPDSRITT